MSDEIVTRLRICESEYGSGDTCREAADEIELLRKLAKGLYKEMKRCGSKHDVPAVMDWEEYEQDLDDE